MQLDLTSERLSSWRAAFSSALERFPRDQEILILTHHDTDGLSAGAILQLVFQRIFRPAAARILGRGENPWTEEVQVELRQRKLGGLVVADLGTRPGVIRPDTPTILIDHHVPLGFPAETTVISAYGLEPTPTAGLITWWCCQELAEVEDLLWLAALSILGDLGEKAEFEELRRARKIYGSTCLKEAASLLNAARRAGAGNAQPALELLLKAGGPRDILSGIHPETDFLLKARQEVNAAVEAAKRVAPKIKGNVAVIWLNSPCQVHPLVAQIWRNRLKDQVVIAANRGYRAGWVHFSVRSATGINLIQFLRERAPSSADENYGSGHLQATGGALRHGAWNEFVSGLGFGPELKV